MIALRLFKFSKHILHLFSRVHTLHKAKLYSFQVILKTPNPINFDVHKGYERTKWLGLLQAPFPTRPSVCTKYSEAKVY